jgi:hypothetical protein
MMKGGIRGPCKRTSSDEVSCVDICKCHNIRNQVSTLSLSYDGRHTSAVTFAGEVEVRSRCVIGRCPSQSRLS